MLNGEFLHTTNKSIEIAVVEGYAVAGGFELFISCDLDGPDEVHKMSIARHESRAYKERADAAS